MDFHRFSWLLILSSQGAHEKAHEFHENEYYMGPHHTLYIGFHIMDPLIHGDHHDQNGPKPSKKYFTHGNPMGNHEES